jgi:RimJ/RimL family protein N-acetyltransferase
MKCRDIFLKLPAIRHFLLAFPSAEGWPGFEIGWTLRRTYWGYGYATEAAKVAIAYAFNELQQLHVISLIRPENLASVRVAKRLGEKLEGTIEILGNTATIYGMTREDWLTQRVADAYV